MISISRVINGITLNGEEYLLDYNNDVKLFKNIEAAKLFLKENNIKEFEF